MVRFVGRPKADAGEIDSFFFYVYFETEIKLLFNFLYFIFGRFLMGDDVGCGEHLSMQILHFKKKMLTKESDECKLDIPYFFL